MIVNKLKVCVGIVVTLAVAGVATASLDRESEQAARFLPGLPEEATAPFERFGREAGLVRDAYRRYEILAARSGAEVTFELSGFQTLYPKDYDDHLMTDLRTFGGGWTLRSVMRHVVDPELGLDEVRYEPSWEHVRSWLEHSFPHVVGKSAADVFAGSILEEPPPLAITTYRVEATYGGRSRSYRAAFYFEGGPELRFSVQDHITPGLHYVYRHLPDRSKVHLARPGGRSHTFATDVYLLTRELGP